MKKTTIILLAFLTFACEYRSTDEPENASGLIPPEQISIGGVLGELNDSVNTREKGFANPPSLLHQQIDQLIEEAEKIKQARIRPGKNDFMVRWEELNAGIFQIYDRLTINDIDAWVALNDSLLKYTQDVRFADALERIAYNTGAYLPDEIRIKSFFYTRLYDRIYVNLFGSSALQYEHTTGGVVRIVQDTNYPFDGKIILKFELQDKRYLDLFVRIPEWANRASVTVKGVKYNVVPGQFSEIAKKWENGDEVEIILGLRPVVVERDEHRKAFALTYGSLFLSYTEPENDSLFFEDDDPVRYLRFVSPPDKMPTFTFSGIKDTSLVLQPLFAEKPDGVKRSIWINRR